MSQKRLPYGTRIELICEHCGTSFFVQPSKTKNRYGETKKFCSRECFGASRQVPIEDRFWQKVKIGGEDECWPWQGSRDGYEYGTVRIGDRIQRANRVAFWLTHGCWPDVCMHSCDNPPCCNPKHLSDGTHKKNVEDMISKGRKAILRGEDHPSARINKEIADTIRDEYKSGGVSQQKLAQKYGVHQAHISKIILGKLWN